MKAALPGLLLLLAARARGQGAAQVGGHPPAAVEMELCGISDLFVHIGEIKNDANCMAGCAGGTGICPDDWYPSQIDECNAECGRVFEPFWDQCGEMLTQAAMGGMDEMGYFYDACLETLYPPGSCGTFCNEHTYDCYLDEIRQACCDEQGTNCQSNSDVPVTCPVGCAIVFPEFLETCRDHVEEHAAANPNIVVADFEAFEQECLTNDGIALVEYALDMQSRGCTLDFSESGRRRAQGTYLGTWLDSTAHGCTWDELDDLAHDVDMICCGEDGSNCPAAFDGSVQTPQTCSPACAVSMHEFMSSCGATLENTLGGDSRFTGIVAFEQICLDSADPLFFLNAIRNAVCPDAAGGGGGGH